MKSLRIILLLVILSPLFTGCAAVALGGGAAAYAMLTQENAVKADPADATTKAALQQLLDPALKQDIRISVFRGEVLLIGTVENQDAVDQIGQQAATVEGVTQVDNELKLLPYTAQEKATDRAAWTAIRSAVMFKKGLFSSNYDIYVIKGDIFVIGLLHNEDERKSLLETLLKFAGAGKEVVDLLSVLPQEERPQAAQVRSRIN